MDNIQILLLAAGASRRMGKPKQLLPWGAETLIEHQIKNLLVRASVIVSPQFSAGFLGPEPLSER